MCDEAGSKQTSRAYVLMALIDRESVVEVSVEEETRLRAIQKIVLPQASISCHRVKYRVTRPLKEPDA